MAKRKKSGGKKRKSARRKKRATIVATPKKRSHKRRASSGRKKSHGGKRRAHKRRGTARRFTKYSKVRAHRRRTHNPAELIKYALAAGAGIAAYLATLAATYYATKNPDNQLRNRKIAAVVVFGVAALFLAKKRPLIAAAAAAGGLLAGFGDYLTMKMIGLLPPKPGTTTSSIAAVLPANRLNAVVNASRLRGIGDMGAVPAAPWTQPGPFG